VSIPTADSRPGYMSCENLTLLPVLLDFLMQNKIAGGTVWTGVDGFGKRKRATIKLEGITINMPPDYRSY